MDGISVKDTAKNGGDLKAGFITNGTPVGASLAGAQQ